MGPLPHCADASGNEPEAAGHEPWKLPGAVVAHLFGGEKMDGKIYKNHRFYDVCHDVFCPCHGNCGMDSWRRMIDMTQCPKIWFRNISVQQTKGRRQSMTAPEKWTLFWIGRNDEASWSLAVLNCVAGMVWLISHSSVYMDCFFWWQSDCWRIAKTKKAEDYLLLELLVSLFDYLAVILVYIADYWVVGLTKEHSLPHTLGKTGFHWILDRLADCERAWQQNLDCELWTNKSLVS